MKKEIKKKIYDDYPYTDGGVCASKDFVAGGLNCGINPDKTKEDLAIIYSSSPCAAAAVYTQNKVKGAPILVTRQNLKQSKNKAQVVVVNSKNANTCNANGQEVAQTVCDIAAREFAVSSNQVVVASTGIIGQPLPIEPFTKGIPQLAKNLSPKGHAAAARAIMTTDTVPKEVAVSFFLQGKRCHLGGMAKGSGMICPNMATTLNFITTDVAISSALLQKALDEVVKVTYNCLSVDGDTSTNDMVCVLANGAAQNEQIVQENADYRVFWQALYVVMEQMTRMLAADGEGATKLLECVCEGAKTTDTAIAVAKSVVKSNLFKCAMFGEDANWGRILCAVGYASAEFDIQKVNVDLVSAAGEIAVCRDGSGVEFSEETAAKILAENEILIRVDLQEGESKAKAWGCDLTYDYVKINGDYRT